MREKKSYLISQFYEPGKLVNLRTSRRHFINIKCLFALFGVVLTRTLSVYYSPLVDYNGAAIFKLSKDNLFMLY